MCVTRCIVRWGLIGGLVLGGATLLVGPDRVAAGLASIRGKVQTVVDTCVDDPVALRRQLQELSEEYPERIAEVDGQIAVVDNQLDQLRHDIEVDKGIIAMTTDDLHELRTKITRAESDSRGVRRVRIHFDGFGYDVDEAVEEAKQIKQIRDTYQDRLEFDKHQSQFLQEQKARLTDIRDKLEQESSTLNSQLLALDREIDAIDRNERLIELTEQQNETLASYNKYEKVGNLKQLQSRLRQIRTEQESRLEALNKRSRKHDYEAKVIIELDDQGDLDDVDPFEDLEKTEETEDDTVAFLD